MARPIFQNWYTNFYYNRYIKQASLIMRRNIGLSTRTPNTNAYLAIIKIANYNDYIAMFLDAHSVQPTRPALLANSNRSLSLFLRLFHLCNAYVKIINSKIIKNSHFVHLKLLGVLTALIEKHAHFAINQWILIKHQHKTILAPANLHIFFSFRLAFYALQQLKIVFYAHREPHVPSVKILWY